MSVAELEEEVLQLRKALQCKEDELLKRKEQEIKIRDTKAESWSEGVPKWAVERYSRQCLVTELGPPLLSLHTLAGSSVLVVGAGGLGCPAAGYLAGAGVGHIGIVDYDDVEVTNIHRQLLHSEMTVGMAKVESAAMAMRRINSTIKVTPYNVQLDSSNALEIILVYDCVIDATDNVVTRYLLNDACVMSGKPLVSASALKLEGQLTIYNYRPKDSQLPPGPCMRCLFPVPPPPETVGSCSGSGVLGPVPGAMGTLQALECLKLLLGRETIAGHMLLFDGADCSFRRVKLRGRSPQCVVCSDSPTITKLIDYTQFCNSQASDKDLKLEILSKEERIEAKDFKNRFYQNLFPGINKTRKGAIENSEQNEFLFKKLGEDSLLLDVRSKEQFEMCHIEGSSNVSIDKLEQRSEDLVNYLQENGVNRVFCICRRGNDSQLAVQLLKVKFSNCEHPPSIVDIAGGLHSWAEQVDNNFPIY